MAYSAIPDTEIEPGKPGSSGLFTKMRDNPEAIAAGIDPAPKIANAALADNTVNGVKLVSNTVDFSAKTLAHDDVAIVWNLPHAVNYIVPKGIWIIRNSEEGEFISEKFLTDTGWIGSAQLIGAAGLIISDGINCALVNATTPEGIDVYARKIY